MIFGSFYQTDSNYVFFNYIGSFVEHRLEIVRRKKTSCLVSFRRECLTMNKSTLQYISKLSVIILLIIGLAELGLALWTVFDERYKILAYNLADIGYIVSNKHEKKLRRKVSLRRTYRF